MIAASCDRARRELMRGVDRVSGRTARHVESCAGCDDFAARLARARDGLRAHRAVVLPDAGFASRVLAAGPAGAVPGEAMSRAALRLLPAALALVLLLGAWCWLGTSTPASLAESAASAAGDDVLYWVLANGS